MPKILKAGNAFIKCFTPKEADRIPNVLIGKNSNIVTNKLLEKDARLSKYVNEATMGALDSFAQKEKLNIYITPLENDLFDDLKVSVYPKGHNRNKGFKFAMKLTEGRHSLAEFLTGLNRKITDGLGKTTKVNHFVPAKKPSKLETLEMWAQNIFDRLENHRMQRIETFIDKYSTKKGLRGTFANALKEAYGEGYNL